MTRYISEIFEEKPERYGFRGDPYFWDYLREHFQTQEFTYSVTEFTDEIYRLFLEVTGEELTVETNPCVERFAHGGMSSGKLNGDFWINTGIPLLAHRYHEVANMN